MVRCLFVTLFLFNFLASAMEVATLRHECLQNACARVKEKLTPELIFKLLKLPSDIRKDLVHYLLRANEARRARFKEFYDKKTKFELAKTIDFSYVRKPGYRDWVKKVVLCPGNVLLMSVYYIKREPYVDDTHPERFEHSRLYVIDLNENKILYEEGFPKKIVDIACSSNGAHFAVAAESVYLYKREDFSKKVVLENAQPQSLKFHHNGHETLLYVGNTGIWVTFKDPYDVSDNGPDEQPVFLGTVESRLCSEYSDPDSIDVDRAADLSGAIKEVNLTTHEVRTVAETKDLHFFSLQPGTSNLFASDTNGLFLWDTKTAEQKASIKVKGNNFTDPFVFYDSFGLKIIAANGIRDNRLHWELVKIKLRENKDLVLDAQEGLCEIGNHVGEKRTGGVNNLACTSTQPFAVVSDGRKTDVNNKLKIKLYHVYSGDIEGEHDVGEIRYEYNEGYTNTGEPIDILENSIVTLNRSSLQGYLFTFKDFEISLQKLLFLDYFDQPQNKAPTKRQRSLSCPVSMVKS